MDIVSYTEFLVKSLCPEKDLVSTKVVSDTEDSIELYVLVPESCMSSVIGTSGKNIKSIRCLVDAYSYLHDKKKVDLTINSF